MNVINSVEVTEINEERVIRNQKDVDPCFGRIIAGLYFTVVGKAELVNNVTGQLAEVVSKWCIERIALCLLAAWGKMQEERSKCRKELLNKR